MELGGPMPEIAIHLGAHRTGTTALQQYLNKQKAALESRGVLVICPPLTRSGMLDGLIANPARLTGKDISNGRSSVQSLHELFVATRSAGNRLLLSEENILGTMENNLQHGAMYPDLEKRLVRFGDAFEEVDTFYISVRNLVDWWSSCLAFLIKQGTSPPDAGKIAEIASSNRTWREVIQSIMRVFPRKRMVIRDFGLSLGNQARQLAMVTGWIEEFSETEKLGRSNPSNSTESLRRILHERGDAEGAERLPNSVEYLPFSDSQAGELQARYEADVEWLKKSLRKPHRVLFRKDSAKVLESSKLTNFSMGGHSSLTAMPSSSNAAICVLHVGKTAGTFFRDVLQSAPKLPDELKLLDHKHTLASTLRDFGFNRKLAILFRNPAERFVSAFYSRLRQGRPTYNSIWTPSEAASFSFFSTPTELAEALFSSDERARSAAYFAMNSIQHINKGYEFYLESPKVLEAARPGIVICCDVENLNARLQSILKRLDVNGPVNVEGARLHKSPLSHALSKCAGENLRKYWTNEFLIYEKCKEIEGDIGLET
jgi:hypothetical protein